MHEVRHDAAGGCAGRRLRGVELRAGAAGMTSPDDDTVKNYVTPRDAALLALDLNWARLHWPGTPPDDETQSAMHTRRG